MIDVKSTKGEGTTFRIFLPASGSELPERKPMPDGMLGGNETILLVDDEEMITNIGKEMLEKLGYRVLTAVNGEEALRIFSENSGQIEMVILDMVMPVMGGGETFDRIREMDPQAKVLLSSGYSIDGQATEILKRGCNGFIQKPFDLKDLSLKLREIMDRGI
jgi:CheY-like chemotaxis protein